MLSSLVLVAASVLPSQVIVYQAPLVYDFAPVVIRTAPVYRSSYVYGTHVRAPFVAVDRYGPVVSVRAPFVAVDRYGPVVSVRAPFVRTTVVAPYPYRHRGWRRRTVIVR